MATLADSLVSSSSRKLPIRKRPDLRARQHRYQGRIYWVVKDPVALQYFRFEEEEFAILQMLDGHSSLDEIAQRFERDFPPQTIRTEELQQFVGQLHRSGLVLTDSPGQGRQLVKRRDEKVWRQRVAAFANIMSLRFKGVDPERFFNFIYPYVRWFFSVQALVICLVMALCALTLVLVQFDLFRSRLPSFQNFFQAQNWMWLALTLTATKILHELGHGMSCKHFGGECHEIGVMFLVLTPCLYCNVSDSWMLPNRWHRAAIGAAGMYVEVVLASICTFIWWFTEPGPLNYTALNVMFISSVSTLLFNANPLLRYDGYYILSDIMEIPNLRQKASTILNRKLGKWCLGLEEPEDPFLPKRKQWLFATYTVASAIYRWIVVLSILYFLNKVFEPYRLKIIGQIIALASIYGLVLQPVVKAYQFFKIPGRLGKVKRWRMYTTLAVLGAAVAAICFIPLPSHVYAPLDVQARDAATLYVDVPGFLDAVYVKPGDQVSEGQLLARLSNIDIDLDIANLTGQQNICQAQLEGLERTRFSDPHASDDIERVQEALESAKTQLDQREEDKQKLTLVAPRAGTVLPPPRVENPSGSDAHLPRWAGSPFDRENLGAALEIGTKFCQIGDPHSLEARLVIDQGDVEFVTEGQRVEIILNQSAEIWYVSEIERVSTHDLKVSPPNLSGLHGGPLPTQMNQQGVPEPLTPVYEALVPLPTKKDDPKSLLRIGLVGNAKIKTAPRTLFNRLYRYISRTFNFEL